MFCNLEKHNGVQKFVPQLIVENQEGQEYTITNQKEVEQEILRYYEYLYRNQDDKISFNSIEEFMGQDVLTSKKRMIPSALTI